MTETPGRRGVAAKIAVTTFGGATGLVTVLAHTPRKAGHEHFRNLTSGAWCDGGRNT